MINKTRRILYELISICFLRILNQYVEKNDVKFKFYYIKLAAFGFLIIFFSKEWHFIQKYLKK